MAEKADDIQRILAEQDWDSLVPRLLAFAVHEIQRYDWRGTSGGYGDADRCVLPGGKGPKDLVQDAVAKVLEGQRVWDPQQHADLLFYLIGIVKSDISTIAYGQLNQLERRELILEGDEGTPLSTFDVLPDGAPSARERVEKINSEFIAGFHDSLKNEPDLQKMMDCMIDGETKPSDIARSMELPVSQVNNMQKRMRRRRNEFVKEWAAKSDSMNAEDRK